MLDKKIFEELQEYIHLHLNLVELKVLKSSDYTEDTILEESIFHSEIEDFIKTKRQPTLKEVLFTFIDNKGFTDPEIYKRAGIDRKLFSKIRTNPSYRPGKNTIISLALALELNKKETDKLLSSAGYSLSESDTSDLVILFCLEKEIYDIHDVNLALDHFSLKSLGGLF
jgi:hypothetical protein